MMTGSHPHDLDLLAYVEEELHGDAGRAVAEHLAECEACATGVRELEIGRATLRSAPPLELPAERRERLAGELARHGRAQERERRRFLSPLRLVAVLAPVAVVVTAVVGVATLVRDGDDVAGGDAAVEALDDPAAEEAEGDPMAEEKSLGAGPTATGPVGSFLGPAGEVAELLRQRGFDASVEGERVVVRRASAPDVFRVLRPRPPGPVPVVVE